MYKKSIHDLHDSGASIVITVHDFMEKSAEKYEFSLVGGVKLSILCCRYFSFLMEATDQQQFGIDDIELPPNLVENAVDQVVEDLGMDRRSFLGASILGTGAIALHFAAPGGISTAEGAEVEDDRSWVGGYFDKSTEAQQAIINKEPWSKYRRADVEREWYAKEQFPEAHGRIFPDQDNKGSKWTERGMTCDNRHITLFLFQPGAVIKGRKDLAYYKGGKWNLMGFNPSLDKRVYTTNKDKIQYSLPVRAKLADAEAKVKESFNEEAGFRLAAK